jgi:hypothetical protein
MILIRRDKATRQETGRIEILSEYSGDHIDAFVKSRTASMERRRKTLPRTALSYLKEDQLPAEAAAQVEDSEVQACLSTIAGIVFQDWDDTVMEEGAAKLSSQ